MRTQTKGRQESIMLALEAFRFLRHERDNNHLNYTLDWWSRSLSDVGPGFLIIAFRHCDLRELV